MSIHGSIYRLSVAILFNKELLASFQTASFTILKVQSWDGSCHIPCCRGGTNYLYFALTCLQQPYVSCILHLMSSKCFLRMGEQEHSSFTDGETEAAVSLGSLTSQSHMGNRSLHSLISHPSACFISSLISVAQIPQSGHALECHCYLRLI